MGTFKGTVSLTAEAAPWTAPLSAHKFGRIIACVKFTIDQSTNEEELR